VSWREFLLRNLATFPRTFEADELYQLAPAARLEFPENRHVLEKLRQTLQVLRDEGIVGFGPEPGQYTLRKELGPGGWPWQPGEVIDRGDLAQLFGQQGIGGLRRGMFRPAAGNAWNKHMVLFHDEVDNPYGDAVREGRIVYVGEGQQGDQTLTRNNKHLARHREEGVHVHYFVQPRDLPGRIRYEGEVLLEGFDVAFRPAEGRAVFEFTLVKTGHDAIRHLGQELVDIDHQTEVPPGYEERRETRAASRRIYRDPMFRSLVITAYEELCSACGAPLRKEPLLDLQAAHIIPVTERGRDDVRNGLALCARHHWCFDSGFFTIKDDHTVRWLAPQPDPHEEVKNGMRLHVPREPRERPHPFYLGHHRRKWAQDMR